MIKSTQKRIPLLLCCTMLTAISVASAQTTHEYDALGRLKKTGYDNGSGVTYNYDKVGNRTSIQTFESPPVFSVSDGVGTEGGTVRFTVTYTGAQYQSEPILVDYSTSNLTATAGSDYSAASGSLLFFPGGGGFILNIQTIDDALQEGPETFQFNLSNPFGASTIADGTGIGTINDNDSGGPVSFSVNDVSVIEGGDLVYTVTKAGDDSLTHSVDYDSKNGTATGSDYTNTVGTLTFTSSETTKTVSVPTGNDFDEEPDETVILELDNVSSGATISDDQGIGTIINNDGAAAPVQFSVNDVSVTEGGDLVYTVTKTGDDGLTHAVDYDSKNGTATGSDYDNTVGTLTFTSAQTSKTVAVPTEPDTDTESDETVILELDNATNGAAISDNQGVGTIIDND